MNTYQGHYVYNSEHAVEKLEIQVTSVASQTNIADSSAAGGAESLGKQTQGILMAD